MNLSSECEPSTATTPAKDVNLSWHQRIGNHKAVAHSESQLDLAQLVPPTPPSRWWQSRSRSLSRSTTANGDSDKSHLYLADDANISRVLNAVSGDHQIQTNKYRNANRRTVLLHRHTIQEKCGFALETYQFRVGDNEQQQTVTYVDHVQLNTPASRAGLRAGDILISINGEPVLHWPHPRIVTCIAQHTVLRLVVLFDNCTHKVQLCERRLRLQQLINEKRMLYDALDTQEAFVLKRLQQNIDDVQSSDTDDAHDDADVNDTIEVALE